MDIYFETQNVHTIDPSSDFILSIYAAVAQEESRSVSLNCQWQIQKKFEAGIMTPCLILGYDFKDDTLVINETEAETVRLIFSKYLEGKGYQAIADELNAAGYKTKRGGKFGEIGISTILRNEKYSGDLLLQKWFRTDHLTKKEVANKGERDMYFVGSHHEAIIDRETFDRVQQMLETKKQKYSGKPSKKGYPFSSILVCGKCGANYRRKTTAAGTKYEKAVWICQTYNRFGKSACASRQIPEDILYETTAAVLGLDSFDEQIFKKKITGIDVLDNNTLLFHFKDGSTREATWQHKSRAESWTPEMKQKARNKSNGYCANHKSH